MNSARRARGSGAQRIAIDTTAPDHGNGLVLQQRARHSVRTETPVTRGAHTASNGRSPSPRARWVTRPIAEVKSAVEGPIVRNAAALYGTTIVTSLLGFVYWF